MGRGHNVITTRLVATARARFRLQLRLWMPLLAGVAFALAPTSALAQNLVADPGFEMGTGCAGLNMNCTGAAFWTYSGAAYNDSTHGHNGVYALGLASGANFTPSNNNNGLGSGTASQSINVSTSGIYTFSFWEVILANHFTTLGSATFSLSATMGGQTTFNGNVSNNCPNPGSSCPSTYMQQTANVKLAVGSNAVLFSGSYVSGNLNSLLLVDDVSLMLLSPALVFPQGSPTNQTNVGNAINNLINGGGTLPTNFQNLLNLSSPQLQTALTQLDGEAATDAEKGAFALMNQFLGLMLDPFVDGRFGAPGGPIGFAPDQQASFPPDIALAYASVLKAPPPSLAQRWTAWGSGFGASSTTSGNANIGSNNVTVSDYGFAGGMDYHLTHDTSYGFALAGAGTNWGLAQGIGGGRSEAFQAGVYGKSYWGPAYLAGALAFANNWFSTDRTALGDELTARFAGQSYGGRLETGYRYGLPVSGGVIGATPYAAIQTQWFHTPTYSETDLAGGGLGLTYNAMTANDTRSELGARFDDPTLLNGMPLILRARLAWAHDWVSNPALDAVFQSLPGSSFVVNGATPPKDSALASAGAQYFFSPAWSFAAKFDGEFASNSQTYGGSGTLRYTW
jgi:uncharacterized protein YhjY with autotransporter beta-barrel domain